MAQGADIQLDIEQGAALRIEEGDRQSLKLRRWASMPASHGRGGQRRRFRVRQSLDQADTNGRQRVRPAPKRAFDSASAMIDPNRVFWTFLAAAFAAAVSLVVAILVGARAYACVRFRCLSDKPKVARFCS
jgi:hypothetical protein